MMAHDVPLPRPPEFMSLEGEGASSRLLVSVMEKRLASLGCSLDRRLIVEALFRAGSGYMAPEKMGNLVLSSGREGKGDLVATIGGAWKVSMYCRDEEEGGSVVVWAKGAGTSAGGDWYSQDLPDGSAAKILVTTCHDSGSEEGKLAYVCRESHMFEGMLWDPSADRPAEVAYYPSGGVYWRSRYQNGMAKARPGAPVFENYWENGSARILEFGNDLVGKSRNPSEGPAYSEYYPDGRPAAEIYAERRWNEAAGCSVLVPGWRARYFDTSGERTIRKVLLETKKDGGSIGEETIRDMIDLGESKMEEQLFIEKFTESIRLKDCTHPSPFFIPSRDSHVNANTAAAKLAQGLARGNASVSTPRIGNLGTSPTSPPLAI